MSGFKVKISERDITFGPKRFDLDKLEALAFAQELIDLGYRRVSNAYCRVAKIDREDWINVLAKQLNCAPADFYKLDGSGIDDRWRDHYVRVYSNNTLTVSPSIVRLIKAY